MPDIQQNTNTPNNLKQRYQQASKEARWALISTMMYLIGWCACAYLPKQTSGLMGFPLWFELSCMYLPILFILFAHWLIKHQFQEIDLNPDQDQNKDS